MRLKIFKSKYATPAPWAVYFQPGNFPLRYVNSQAEAVTWGCTYLKLREKFPDRSTTSLVWRTDQIVAHG